MKSMKLNTSTKYKNNKFQIKYLKAKLEITLPMLVIHLFPITI